MLRGLGTAPAGHLRCTGGAVDRFLREARNSASLRHPHIVPGPTRRGRWTGERYLVTALVEGRNLADEIANGRPGFRRAAEWSPRWPKHWNMPTGLA